VAQALAAPLVGRSLCLVPKSSPLRKAALLTVRYYLFDTVMLVLILANCVNLAMSSSKPGGWRHNPGHPPFYHPSPATRQLAPGGCGGTKHAPAAACALTPCVAVLLLGAVSRPCPPASCSVCGLTTARQLPAGFDQSRLGRTLEAIDLAFLSVFTLEAVLKIIAYGLWAGPETYLRDGRW
jgi:hypothetical protein